jgi:hypothetical protein
MAPRMQVWLADPDSRYEVLNYPPSLQWTPPGLTIQLRFGAHYTSADSVVEAQTYGTRYRVAIGFTAWRRLSAGLAPSRKA